MVDPPFEGSSWVREFYVILFILLWDDLNPTIHIKGVDVSMNVFNINEDLWKAHILNVEYLTRFSEMDMK